MRPHGNIHLAAMLLTLHAAYVVAGIPSSPPHPGSQVARSLVGVMSVRLERDRDGRICAPVMLNGKGPFQLIVDTGANRTAVTPVVAQSLGLTPEDGGAARLHGVTGSSPVSLVRVDSMSVGGLELPAASLPVVADATSGADGFLGLSGLTDHRLVIDLDGRQMYIADTTAPAPGAVRIPAQVSDARMLVIEVRIRGLPVRAVLDTGAGGTIGNLALLRALGNPDLSRMPEDRIVGATAGQQAGRTASLPQIELGPLRIRGARASFGDLPVFDYFRLGDVPSLLIGMDVIGRFASVAVDYAHGEVQLRPRARP